MTAQTDDEVIKGFEQWAGQTLPQMLSDNLLDTMMLEYLETLYFEGHNHASGDRLMAALEYRDTKIKKGRSLDPKRSRDATRGFRRLVPGLSRVPLPG